MISNSLDSNPPVDQIAYIIFIELYGKRRWLLNVYSRYMC